MNRTKLWLKLHESFWFAPALYGLCALILAWTAVNIDFSYPEEQLKAMLPNLLIVDTQLATTLLSTLTQSILTMTTITFSTIMIVLTTFSGQFSPRILQNFISDRVTQRVLAVFVSGFIYNLTTLLFMKQVGGPEEGSLFLTTTVAVTDGILCVGAFVYFIHHVSKWVQVNNLIDKLTKEALHTISHFYNELSYFKKGNNHDWTESRWENRKGHDIFAAASGYIGMIDFAKLMKQAQADDATVHLEVFIGEYVVNGTKLFTCFSDDTNFNPHPYRAAVTLSPERTGGQDIEFSIQKLVEIALRAISPAINDPHTAINCINRIGRIIGNMAERQPFPTTLYGHDNQPRVLLKQHDLDHYLYKAFYQIRYYGKEDISVTIAILSVFQSMAIKASPAFKQSIWEFANDILEGFNDDVLMPLDKSYLQHERNKLAEVTGHAQ